MQVSRIHLVNQRKKASQPSIEIQDEKASQEGRVAQRELASHH